MSNGATTPPVAAVPDKPKKEKKEPTVRRSKFVEIYPDDAVVKILAAENPKKEGSKAHERFKLYSGIKTVKGFIDAGGTYQDIAYNVGRQFISVTPK